MKPKKTVTWHCPFCKDKPEMPDSLVKKKDGIASCPHCNTNMERRVKKE